MQKLKYCETPYRYKRRLTREITVGKVKMGADNPIVVQSMITCDTMDTKACVEQTLDLVKVGSEIVRITAPTIKDAANLKNIKKALTEAGCDVPLVADIHFKPDAALEAAQWVEAVRINPGNFADKKKFQSRDYTEDQYEEELERIEEVFAPLLEICIQRKIAMRIGTNHGSLSDRIMNRHGDTALGMVESSLEYARVARKYNFHNFNFSMKSSNPKVMIEAYRLLVAHLELQGDDWNYPLHLGVTEAGDGEDGRIKSAIGIGSLLADGIGDTIRVSLTEDSVHEIPVGKALVSLVKDSSTLTSPSDAPPLSFNPFDFEKRSSTSILVQGVSVGGEETIRVCTSEADYLHLTKNASSSEDIAPEFIFEKGPLVEIDIEDKKALLALGEEKTPQLITIKDGCPWSPLVAFRYLAAKVPSHHSILLKDTFTPPHKTDSPNSLETLLHASIQIGGLLCDGIGDAILVRSQTSPEDTLRLSYNILQAAGSRTFKTDYVACPSCGRTLFDLQSTTQKIREATQHLKGVKIAVMGCIVNGPGEMADADFGYVGGAPNKINLYVGRKAVQFNIPEAEAVEKLKDLIKEHGKWIEPRPAS